MKRGGRVRPRRATPRRRGAPRGDADWWATAGWLLTSRAFGCCEICGDPLRPDFTSRHHRMRRRDGGDRLANLLLLCGDGTRGCHGHIAEHPAEAIENGWIVPTHADVLDVPARLANGELYYLHDDGTRTPIDPPNQPRRTA